MVDMVFLSNVFLQLPLSFHLIESTTALAHSLKRRAS